MTCGCAHAPNRENKRVERRNWLELKANAVTREVEGYASTWDPDDVGDQIQFGAFRESIEERHNRPLREKGRSDIRVLWQHEDPIGVLLDCKEDEHGLWIKVRISKTTLGDDVLQLLADGAVDRMSIGYMVPPGGASNRNGLRIIKRCGLWEVSFVTFPANPATSVDQVKCGRKTLGDLQLEVKAAKCAVLWSENGMEVKGMNGVEWDEKAGRIQAGRNIERIKSMVENAKGVLETCEKMLEEAAAPNPRSQDAGGRGEPPSNHDVARDERKGSSARVTCPHCKCSLTLAGDVAPLGQPEPKPDSIANAYPGPYAVPQPEPDSIAELVPSLGQPEPRPDSIAGQELPGNDSPNYSETDESALTRLASGPSHTWDDFAARPMPTPGNRPGGPGPYPVPTPHPYSVAGQDGAEETKGSNVSSSHEMFQLEEQMSSLLTLVDRL